MMAPASEEDQLLGLSPSPSASAPDASNSGTMGGPATILPPMVDLPPASKQPEPQQQMTEKDAPPPAYAPVGGSVAACEPTLCEPRRL